MRIVKLLFVILLPISALGQIDYRLSYHPYINKAELAIVDSNFKLALENYHRAFKMVEIGFGRDYHNAALCAIELGKFDDALQHLSKLAFKGVEKSYFVNNKDDYIELHNNGFEEFLDEYDELRKNSFDITVNYHLIGALGEMENRDQEFRYDTKLNRDTIQIIDAENISKFIQLVNEYGFPSEEMLGLQSPFSNSSRYHLIIWHHLKNWNINDSLIDIRPLIMDAVKSGRLSPEQAAAYLNISEAKLGGIGNYGNTGVIRFDDSPKLYILDCKDVDFVNANRNEIGLCSLSDSETKYLFHYIEKENKSKYKVLSLGTIDQYPSEVRSVIDVKQLVKY